MSRKKNRDIVGLQPQRNVENDFGDLAVCLNLVNRQIYDNRNFFTDSKFVRRALVKVAAECFPMFIAREGLLLRISKEDSGEEYGLKHFLYKQHSQTGVLCRMKYISHAWLSYRNDGATADRYFVEVMSPGAVIGCSSPSLIAVSPDAADDREVNELDSITVEEKQKTGFYVARIREYFLSARQEISLCI